MTRFETHVQQLFQANGWQSLRGGWPDFLMYRISDHKKIELVAVEAKATNDTLRAGQERMLALLSTAMPVRVVSEGPSYGPFFGQWESKCQLYDLSRYEKEKDLWLTPQIDPIRILECNCVWDWCRHSCPDHRFQDGVASAKANC